MNNCSYVKTKEQIQWFKVNICCVGVIATFIVFFLYSMYEKNSWYSCFLVIDMSDEICTGFIGDVINTLFILLCLLTVRLALYLYSKPTRCTVFFSLSWATTFLHVSGPFVAHHQEAKCIMWWMVLVFLVSTIRHTIHSASWWWDTNGPETCRGVLTQ
jgi:hypothetical protein